MPNYDTFPAVARANIMPRIDPLYPYTIDGRMTIPRRAGCVTTACSTAGRQATSETGSLMGVVSVTISVRLSPCTQVPEV